MSLFPKSFTNDLKLQGVLITTILSYDVRDVIQWRDTSDHSHDSSFVA